MNLRLRDLVEALKVELQPLPSSDPKFRLTSARITTKVIARESVTAKGGIEFLVFRAGAEGATAAEEAHEVTIDLGPLGEITLGDPRPDVG